MGSAAKEVTQNNTSLDGMEAVFTVESQIENKDSQDKSQVILGEIQEPETVEDYENDDSYILMSVPDASLALEVPQSTLYRHIKAGKYKAVRGKDSQMRVALRKESLSDSQDFHSSGNSDSQQRATESQIIEGFQGMSERIIQMSERLESANYQIGYLTSQLESSSEKVKLLEDKSIEGEKTKADLEAVQADYLQLEEELEKLIIENERLKAIESQSKWRKLFNWFLGR